MCLLSVHPTYWDYVGSSTFFEVRSPDIHATCRVIGILRDPLTRHTRNMSGHRHFSVSVRPTYTQHLGSPAFFEIRSTDIYAPCRLFGILQRLFARRTRLISCDLLNRPSLTNWVRSLVFIRLYMILHSILGCLIHFFFIAFANGYDLYDLNLTVYFSKHDSKSHFFIF